MTGPEGRGPHRPSAPWHHPWRPAPIALALAVGLVVAGCGTRADGPSGDGVPGAAPVTTPSSSSVPHAGHGAPVTRTATVVPPPGAQVPGDAAVQLRSRLEELMGAHVLLADELVRARLRGRSLGPVVEATSAALTRNRQGLVDLVTAQAGAATGDQFSAAWGRHVDLLATYAGALHEGQTAEAQGIRSAYGQAEEQLAEVFGVLVGRTVPAADLLAAARAHGEHLLGQADAVAAGDHDRAHAVQREGFGHAIVIADVLARGAATAKALPTAELDAPRKQLQTALSRLLAEHMGVTVQVMRAAHDAAAEFPAAGRALNANTAELGSAIGTLYGDAAGSEFLALWAQHIEGLVTYARAAGDRVAQDRARQQQVDYAPRLARFLAAATDQRLPTIDLAAALTEHDDHLLDQADAYAGGDAEGSQQLADRGYAHMFQLASALATAVGDAVASRMPTGGAATGGGALDGPR